MANLPRPSNLASYKRVTGANPAANGEVADAVPAGKSWFILAVTLTMVQGATQTPQPILQIDDGVSPTNIVELFGSSAAQAVSSTCVYQFAPGLPLSGQIGSAAAVHSSAPLPSELLLGSGFRIKTTTLGIGANSDYSASTYYVCEFG
jgi:hypothetical protein